MENIQTVEPGKIQPDAMVQEIETGSRQFRAAFTGEHGIKLAPELFRDYNPLTTRKGSEDLEEELATTLKAAGHAVWWN